MTDKEKIILIREIIRLAYAQQLLNEWDEAVIFGNAIDEIDTLIG